MKLRLNFVSNSSTSSYIVQAYLDLSNSYDKKFFIMARLMDPKSEWSEKDKILIFSDEDLGLEIKHIINNAVRIERINIGQGEEEDYDWYDEEEDN